MASQIIEVFIRSQLSICRFEFFSFHSHIWAVKGTVFINLFWMSLFSFSSTWHNCTFEWTSDLHSGFSNSLIVFKCFIVMHFVRVSLIMFLALKNRQKTLWIGVKLALFLQQFKWLAWWMQMYCCSVWTIQTLSLRISNTIPKMSTTSYLRIP